MATLSGQLPGLTNDLATGSRLVTNGVFLLGDALWSVGSYAQENITDSGALATDIDSLKTYVQANVTAGPAKTAILNQLTALQANADSLVAQTVATNLAVDAGAAAAEIIGTGSSYVSDGTDLLAEGMPLFSTGLSAAEQGAGLLASGLNVASEALPKYSADQSAQLAKVISQPVKTDLSSVPPLPPAVTAVAAFTIPIALWFGALVLSLVYRPYEPRTLRTRSSSGRIVWGAILPPAGFALMQAVLITAGAAVVGVSPVHHLGLIMLVVLSAVSFVILHQGLRALFGRSAWLASIALLGLQIVAAGVLVPSPYLPKWVSGLGDVLPLSQSIQASQVFLTGGTFSVGLDALFWLVLTAVIGIVMLVISVSRGRMNSLTQISAS
jgi:putative membrane protein